MVLILPYRIFPLKRVQYGRTFALSLQSSETAPDTVPPRIASKLSLYTPSKDLVDAYLSEIARGYGVKWVPDHEREEAKLEGNGQGIGEDEDDVDDIDDARAGAGAGDSGSGGTGGPGEGQQKEPSTVLETAKNRTPVLPAAPTYPAGQEKDAWSIEQTRGGAGVAPGGGGVGGGKKLSEEEELAQRFERLKNLR